MAQSVIQRGSARVVFGRGSAAMLGEHLDALPSPPKRVVFVGSGGREAVLRSIAAPIGDRCVGVLAIAREHVPAETVAEALPFAAKSDAVVAIGGGSAIGLAKALAVQSDHLRTIALPTTFSGSEMTPVFGVTDRQDKRVGRDERARPSLVIYDGALSDGLPTPVAIASVWNAIAHAVEALWAPNGDRATRLVAEEAVRVLAKSVRRIEEQSARDAAFEGAHLAGAVFADVGGGIHHKLCHVLGGMFGLPHASTHAALLPHVARWIAGVNAAADAFTALSRALDALDPVRALEQLARDTGVPRTLAAVGFSRDGIDRVVERVLASPPPSPRPVDAESLRSLLVAASAPVLKASPVGTTTTLRAPDVVTTQPGFGGTHDSEALPGALPKRQNAPRPAPYGLYPELLSGTPFTTKNVQNSRVWMYRIRPSFSHAVYRRLPSARFTGELGDVEPNRTRWMAMPIPKGGARVDFLDGLATLGGDGTAPGPGYLVSTYAANADMVDRCFSTADGDLLIVPQSGRVDVRTELGFLSVPPGSIIVIPRGIKFAVGLPEGSGRGWMLEVFGPRLRLPERGLIGSNGLADARHFLAPTASYEDRLCPDGFETVHKLGGHVYTATQGHSPFDVVAWHGVHVPFAYDLMLFNAMGSVTWDHVDPSIHTVLTAPLDDHGHAVVDFVVFRGRWDVAEHSFRPPFMHRNAASEINAVIKTPAIEGGYEEGCTFLSPLLTSHGIATHSYDEELDAEDANHEGPRRLPDDSLWVMFESALMFRPTAWARSTPLLDATFLAQFEGMKSRFRMTP